MTKFFLQEGAYDRRIRKPQENFCPEELQLNVSSVQEKWKTQETERSVVTGNTMLKNTLTGKVNSKVRRRHYAPTLGTVNWVPPASCAK